MRVQSLNTPTFTDSNLTNPEIKELLNDLEQEIAQSHLIPQAHKLAVQLYDAFNTKNSHETLKKFLKKDIFLRRKQSYQKNLFLEKQNDEDDQVIQLIRLYLNPTLPALKTILESEALSPFFIKCLSGQYALGRYYIKERRINIQPFKLLCRAYIGKHLDFMQCFREILESALDIYTQGQTKKALHKLDILLNENRTHPQLWKALIFLHYQLDDIDRIHHILTRYFPQEPSDIHEYLAKYTGESIKRIQAQGANDSIIAFFSREFSQLIAEYKTRFDQAVEINCKLGDLYGIETVMANHVAELHQAEKWLQADTETHQHRALDFKLIIDKLIPEWGASALVIFANYAYLIAQFLYLQYTYRLKAEMPFEQLQYDPNLQLQIDSVQWLITSLMSMAESINIQSLAQQAVIEELRQPGDSQTSAATQQLTEPSAASFTQQQIEDAAINAHQNRSGYKKIKSTEEALFSSACGMLEITTHERFFRMFKSIESDNPMLFQGLQPALQQLKTQVSKLKG